MELQHRVVVWTCSIELWRRFTVKTCSFIDLCLELQYKVVV